MDEGLQESYEYIARYVDDILVFSREPEELIKCLQVVYPLQGVGIPEYYLGGDFKIHKTQEGVITFTFCAKTYLSMCVKRLKN